MKNLLNQLQEIEKEHSDFFNNSNKKIIDYITAGVFGSQIFINNDLPIEVIGKIRKVFDALSPPFKPEEKP